MKNLKKWIFSIGFTLLLLELALRILHMNQTYTESIGQGYKSYFGRESGSWYLQWPLNDTFMVDHGDFKFKYITNELGVREKPAKAFIDTSAFKIITLGDSYTEGMGTDYDSTWPRFFERDITNMGRKAMVFNAGKNGSDPFYAYMFFKGKLLPLKPALVISAVNETDIDDFFFRGGLGRFKSNGTVVNNKGPWFEPLYHYSFIVRLITVDVLQRRPQLFVTDKEYEKYEDDFIVQATANYVAFKKAFIDSGKLLVAIHPGPDECAYKDHPNDQHNYNVMKRSTDSLRQKGIDAVDLYPAMETVINEENVNDFTFKHDRHFNAKGCKLFADKLVIEILKNYPVILQNSIPRAVSTVKL